MKDELEILDELTKGDKWKQFRFLEHQLGVLDTKAHAIVSLDGFLLALTVPFMTIAAPTNLGVKLALLTSSTLVLISAMVSARILCARWATIIVKNGNIEEGLKRIIALRDKKTSFLHFSVCFLIVAFIGYIITLSLHLLF